MYANGFIITFRNRFRDMIEGSSGLLECIGVFECGQYDTLWITKEGVVPKEAKVFNTRAEADAFVKWFGGDVYLAPGWTASDIKVVEVEPVFRQVLSHWGVVA